MGNITLSDDHNKLGYSFDESGSERYNIYVKDLSTGLDLPDKITNNLGEIVWNKSGDGFYYIALNEHWRGDKVLFHKLGEAQDRDVIIYHELDPGFFLNISRSSSDEYLMIETGNSTSNETHYLSLKTGAMNLSLKRMPDLLYSLDHMNNNFYLTINDKGRNFRLVSSKVDDDFDQEKFEEIIAHNIDYYLVDVVLYERYLAVSKRVLGLNKIEYYDIRTHKLLNSIDFDEEVYEANIVSTTKEDEFMRISYSSLTKPRTILEYEFVSKTLHIRKVDEVIGYIADLYQAKRLWVKSSDGTQVPISMVYRKDSIQAPSKLLLYGYGAYGISMPMNFNMNRISLLDRGFIYVIAHIRGGDELGFNWYESAKFLNKKRSFEDFIAVAEYLIEQGITSSDKLSIMGGSAGGMLVGVVINQRIVPHTY